MELMEQKNKQNEYLMSVGVLIEEEYKFSIPSNQRGYRWRKQQVEDLLNDIFEFYIANKNFALSAKPEETDKEYYCLQPLVVEKKEYFSVIDGQQRLTTIFIFLAYLDKKFEKKRFTIEYRSRAKSQDFLSKIKFGVKPDATDIEFVDYHYMSKALEIIEDWIEKKKESTDELIAHQLCNVIRRAVKFIWYPLETASGENAHDTFKNINANKIPLTDAELIKALLLNNSNYETPNRQIAEMKKLKLAAAWDEIERFFGDDDFWHFIDNDVNPPPTRIDLLFDFYVKANKIDKQTHYDEHILFNKFRDLFEHEQKSIERIWDKISTVYEKIREWYEDDNLYHSIGFLIASGTAPIEIFEEIEKENKDKALGKINYMIKKKLESYKITEPDDICRIEYPNKNIKWLLLLHNIGTIMKSADCGVDNRFSFKKFNKEKWEREHIHASADGARKKEERQIWLDALCKSKIIEYLNVERQPSDAELIEFIQSIDGEKNEDKRKSLALDDKAEKFQDIYGKFTMRFSDINNDKNSLKNLALLSKKINGSYQNAPFPIKREEIIKADKNGEFIPPCTRNVFLKYYTDKSEPMPLIWNNADAEEYFEDIKEILTYYIAYGEETENG